MDWWNKKVEELSKGMAQKVQFIVTVLHRPKLLIFDEPFSGFDPINAELLKNEILRLRDEGATVIFSLINRSHNILSGNVSEVRRQMGKNTYKISFQGNPESLTAALGDRIAYSAIDEPVRDSEGITYSARFRLSADTDMREFLRTAVDTVDLVSFDRALPSMNDIFIQAVSQANAGTPAADPDAR